MMRKILEDNEQFLDVFVRDLPLALAVFDRDMRYVFASDCWRHDYDLGDRPLEGVLHYEIFPEIPEEWREAHRRGLAGEVLRAEADRFERLDGSVQWIRWELRPWHNKADEIGGIIIFTEDLTDIIVAEQKLQKQENLYRELVENSNSAMIRWKSDGTLTFVNEYAQRLFGYTAEDIIGRSVNLLVPEKGSTGENLSDLVRDIVDHPERYQHNINENITRDGRRIWMSWTNRPLFSDGEVTEILAVGSDVTEQKLAQEALRQSEQRLRMALDAAYVISFEWDIQCNEVHRFISYEPALEPTEDDKPGTFDDVLEVIHPDDRELFKKNVEAALEREDGEYESEYRLVRSGGEVAWLYERGRVERDAAGHPVRLVGLSQDITERKKVEADLREAKAAAEKANQAKSEFLANMSHEIRTPMTVFLSAIEYLQDIDKDPEHQAMLKMADKSASHLRNLIDDILNFSKIEAGRIELKEEPTCPQLLVEEISVMFQKNAEEKGLKLSLEIAADVPQFILGDPAKLKQVLVNLIDNAIKFTPGGDVQLTLKAYDDVLEFTVTDTGIGIPEDKQPLLFKHFSQIDPSFHRKHGGTGLGLAISRQLVELMGGQIRVLSQEGKGSVFSLTIPLKLPGPGEFAEQTQPGDALENSAAVRILLVEDDPMISYVISRNLSLRGWRTVPALTGNEALEKWRQAAYDIILMDLQMPGMDGFETTEAIRREEPKDRRVPIIGLTAHARKDVLKKCLEIGMDRVLTKPVMAEKLRTAIEEVLAG